MSAPPASQTREDGGSTNALPLAGETLLVVPEHYDAHAQKTLEGIAVELGAETTSEREKCTMMIVNVHSPKWIAEQANVKHLKPLPTSPEIRSYHWLVLSGRAQRRLDPSELVNETPFMVASLIDRYPVKVWVSKNVSRNADESPEDAQVNTTRDLENAGAIIVAKRAHADVLIVDVQSKFYATVKKEKEAQGRTWQKLAQRDWVEFCVRTKSVTLQTQGEDEGESSAGEDSFKEESSEPVRTGAGPGRPVGKPRIDYTGQDDDFLCRWLAAHPEEGSAFSRRTYLALVNQSDLYPLADRHSNQSWQERYKKNSALFARRVRRFVDEGIDVSLKTSQERKTDREKRAQEAGQETERPEPLVSADTEASQSSQPNIKSSQDTIDASGVTRSVAEKAQPLEAVPEESVEAPPVEAPAGQAAQSAKRRLVEEDPEDTPAITVVTEFETVEVLVPETLPSNHGAETEARQEPDTQASSSGLAPLLESAQILVGTTKQEASVDTERISTVESGLFAAPAGASSGVLQISSPQQPLPMTIDPKLIHVRPASELLGPPVAHTTPSPKRSPKKRRRSDLIAAGSTPLRQEIMRSQEKRQKVVERQVQPGSSRTRAHSPDKVYAFVGIPPRAPRSSSGMTPAPPTRPARTPSPELTAAERQEKILRGSRIVNDVAAQYRAKVSALTRKYGIGPKEISAVTKEMRETGRARGASGLDWERLEDLLAERYGK